MIRKIKVLILEDHQATLDGLKLGLANEQDLEVVATAATSDDGLTLAEQLSPDVILLDLHLPGSMGPKTMVKRFCDLPGCRVLIFSGESRMAFIQAVLSVGVAGYLLKSESIASVAAAIREVASGRAPIVSTCLASNDTRLTRSEQEVLRLLAKGMKYHEMADQRMTSPATVRKQCEMLLLKLALRTREELIAWAVQNGYGSVDGEP